MNKKITIIGAGVVGLACAWRLAAAGWQVKILEQAQSAAEMAAWGGASPAALGALVPYGFNRTDDTPAQQHKSLGMWPQFAAELSQESGVNVHFSPIQRLQFLENEGQRAAAEISASASRGVQKILSAEEVKALIPTAQPPACGALLCLGTAHFSIPDLLAALRTAVAKRGVTIHYATSVHPMGEGGTPAKNHITLETLRADGTVLVAAGAWSSALHPALAHTCPTVPVKGQALRLKPKEKMPNFMLRGKGFYIIPQHNGEVLVGNTSEPEAGFSATPTPAAQAEILARATRILPELAAAEIVSHQAGLRPKAQNGAPFVGEVAGLSGVYAATGHYGIGYCLTPLTAKRILEALN